MKKILSAVLLGTLVLSAFPANAQNLFFDFIEAGKKIVQKTTRQIELNKRALQSIPEKAKTSVRFRQMERLDNDGRATLSTQHCAAIFMDYNEANGLGNVTVGMKASCVEEQIKSSFVFVDARYRGWMEFGVYLTKFGYDPRYNDEVEDFMFLTEVNARGGAYPEWKLVKTAVGNLYIYHMPVQSSSANFQKAFRQLFPNKKSFITLEKAARALAVMK